MKKTIAYSFWNLLGYVLPLFVGLFAIPLLVERLGVQRFGLLALIWMGVGYFTLLDMGLSRALTKLVSQKLGEGLHSDVPDLFWTALYTALLISCLGGALIVIFAPAIVTGLLNVPDYLIAEAIRAIRLLGVGIPVVVASAIVVGFLEAKLLFRPLALVRVMLGTATFLLPLVLSFYSTRIDAATLALLLARASAAVVFVYMALNSHRSLKGLRAPKLETAKSLARFGGWMTVSNVLGPIMVYFDRFFISGALSLDALTKYVAPYEVANRVQLVPQSIVSAAFPSLTTAIAAKSKDMRRTFVDASLLIVSGVLPVCGVLILFGRELMTVWLGPDYAEDSGYVLQLLAVGWLINAFARVPSAALQAAGLPDRLAKLHLAEVVPYTLLVYYSTSQFGIVGTAIAWSIRMIVDALIVLLLCRASLPQFGDPVNKSIYSVVILVILSLLAMNANGAIVGWLGVLAFATLSAAVGAVALRRSGFLSAFRSSK